MRITSLLTITASLLMGAALASVQAEDPKAASPVASTIGCVDAQAIANAYLYRESTLDAITSALDSHDDAWRTTQAAVLAAQKVAMAAGEEGPSEEQWKVMEAAHMALVKVQGEVHAAVEDVMRSRAAPGERDVVAAIERVGPARGCTAVYQRSAQWGKESAEADGESQFDSSSLLWAEGVADLNDDVLKELGLPRDALDPNNSLIERTERLFERLRTMVTMPEPAEHEGDADAEPES